MSAIPDGYTLILVTASYTANAALHNLPYHPVNDITPISLVIIGSLPALIPQVKANRLRGIGVTTAKRLPALPDIPAIAEILPRYEAVNCGAVWSLKALRASVVARWNSEINRIVLLPEIKERLAASGTEPAGGTPERLRDVIARNVAKWQSLFCVHYGRGRSGHNPANASAILPSTAASGIGHRQAQVAASGFFVDFQQR